LGSLFFVPVRHKDLRNGTPGSVQRGESHKKATIADGANSVKIRKVLMAEREGFEPSVQVLARTTV